MRTPHTCKNAVVNLHRPNGLAAFPYREGEDPRTAKLARSVGVVEGARMSERSRLRLSCAELRGSGVMETRGVRCCSATSMDGREVALVDSAIGSIRETVGMLMVVGTDCAECAGVGKGLEMGDAVVESWLEWRGESSPYRCSPDMSCASTLAMSLCGT